MSDYTFRQPYRPPLVRLINGIGAFFDQRGRPLIHLSAESLMAAAQKRTGLSDWGEDTFFITSLNQLLTAQEREAQLNLLGRFGMRANLLRALRNRLYIQHHLKRFPEILEQPIQRPLFIIGLPRTGTTFLHRLLWQDSHARVLRYWETLYPAPLLKTPDPRQKMVQREVRLMRQFMPSFPTMHAIEADWPEECMFLLQNTFATPLAFEVPAHIPSYTAWLKTQDLTPTYRYFRQQLQLLQWQEAGQHWLLKAPSHLFSLSALLTVFPDARIVQTHRDPLEVVPSTTSLAAMARSSGSDVIDAPAWAREIMHLLADGLTHTLETRRTAAPKQFYDVQYRQLVRHPIETVQAIYAHFDLPVEPAMLENLQRWLDENPQHKHGVHRYSLTQFGLEAQEVETLFAAYRAEWLTVD